MRKVYLFFPVFIALVLSLPVVSARDADDENKQFHKQAYDNPHKISVKIQQAIAVIDSGQHLEIEGEYVFSNSVLPEFYANRDYMPAWDNYDALMDAIHTLEHAYVDGLEPADYHADAMRGLVEKIRHNVGGEEAHFEWVAEFDILLTDGLLMYAYHLLDGKVHPESLDPNWNYDFREIDPHAPYILEKAVETASVSEVINQMRPQMKAYASMMELLADYRELARNGGWEGIPDGGTIHPGDNDDRIPLIRKRLAVSGELTEGNDLNSNVYDSLLVADVSRFQHRNALKPDGVIGKGTIDEMNVSVETRIDMLRINMERLRWIVADLTEHFILVNIAAYKVYYYEHHELKHTTNAQVGKLYTKTPVFKGRLRYVEFNPTWTVPVSIIRTGMFEKIKKDPGYLAANNFDLLDASGNIVNPYSLDYGKYTSHSFPYTVRQKPGPDNALGEVKFIFPNPHSVFLHDTPSKSLFDREERAFSHGCVRTQYPLDLAAVILEGSEWNKEKIDATIQTRVTTRAFPDEDIDVLIMYWTAGYYEGDGIGFFKDIYERDSRLLEQLNKVDHRVALVRNN